MSDVEPEFPADLTAAILSTGPGAADLDLVKSAFDWRNIDADLMDVAFDSVDDLAGVRDAGAARTIEFTSASHSVLVEVSAGLVTVTVVPESEGQALLEYLDPQIDPGPHATLNTLGRAEFTSTTSGAARVRVELAGGVLVSPTFTVP